MGEQCIDHFVPAYSRIATHIKNARIWLLKVYWISGVACFGKSGAAGRQELPEWSLPKGGEMQLKAVLLQGEDGESFSSGAARALDPRRGNRRALRLSAPTKSETVDQLPVLVLDISKEGLLLEADPDALSAHASIEIDLPEKGFVKARIAWRSGRFLGCEFTSPVPPAVVAAALLKSEPADPSSEVPAAQGGETHLDESRSRFEPEVNFSAALLLALGLWALIGAAVSLLN